MQRQIDTITTTPISQNSPHTYAYHLSQAHTFVDGNKRIAAVVSEVFLKLNGLKLNATNDEIVEVFLDIAASKLSRENVEEKFAEWLEKFE